jgi:hypothetical protein
MTEGIYVTSCKNERLTGYPICSNSRLAVKLPMLHVFIALHYIEETSWPRPKQFNS